MKTNGVLQFKSQEWYDSKSKQPVKLVEPKVMPVVDWRKDWKRYRNKVNKITLQQDLKSLNHYDERITRSMINEYGLKIYQSDTHYSLDHKISIWYGWKNNISPEVIGDISNLRYIISKDNCLKGTRSEF